MNKATKTIAQKLYAKTDEEIKKAVIGRVVHYQNEGPSSVKVDGDREFTIVGVEKIDYGKKHNRRYMKVDVKDNDKNFKRGFKNLQIGGITKVEHRLVTVARTIKGLL